MVNGIDVSDYQPNVDWSGVHAAGYSFAYTKATEGTGNVQDTFETNWPAMKAAGMLRGAYHFFHFDQDAEAQAKHFLSVYQPTPGDLPPMLDLEAPTNLSSAQCVEAISAFLRVVEPVIKTRCVLYMGFYYWQETLGGTDGFAGHPLWVAQYDSGAAPSLVPQPWKSWTFWQYTDDKYVAGAGYVDADYFYGDLDALKALAIP